MARSRQASSSRIRRISRLRWGSRRRIGGGRTCNSYWARKSSMGLPGHPGYWPLNSGDGSPTPAATSCLREQSNRSFTCSSWTVPAFRGNLPRMTIILVLAVALLAGMLIRNRWALLLPLGVGACAALAIVARGHGLGDTPILFLVVVCTLVMLG